MLVGLPSKLTWFISFQYFSTPSRRRFSAHFINNSLSLRYSKKGTAWPQDVWTSSMFNWKNCLAPTYSSNRLLNSFHILSLGWITLDLPYKRRIKGFFSNEQNIKVILPFSWTWAEVSFPLPVRFNQTTSRSLITLKVSRPLGETLTVPSAPAVPTKKMCCCRTVHRIFYLGSHHEHGPHTKVEGDRHD